MSVRSLSAIPRAPGPAGTRTGVRAHPLVTWALQALPSITHTSSVTWPVTYTVFVRESRAIPPGKSPTLIVAGLRPQPLTFVALHLPASSTETVPAPRSATYSVPVTSLTARVNGSFPAFTVATTLHPLVCPALHARESITETVSAPLFAT